MGKSLDGLKGKHFDTLIHLLNKEYIKKNENANRIGNVHAYLSNIIENSHLFELPICSNGISNISEKSNEEYKKYIDNFLNFSRNKGEFFLRPFESTGIEDLDSVVFVEKKNFREFRVTSCCYLREESLGIDDIITINIGDINLDEPKKNGKYNGSIDMEVGLLYGLVWKDRKRLNSPLNYEKAVEDCSNHLGSAMITFIEECSFILDPNNFIIHKENTQSYKNKKKNSNKKKTNIPLRKKIIRPHYICMNDEEIKDYFKNQTNETRPLHFVRGHIRMLLSDRYKKNMTFVKQHYRGYGNIEGKNGWNYHVMLKGDNPTEIKFYNG